MPVIGRLDGQVDEVLIAPLGRRRRDGDESPADEPGAATENRNDLEQRPAQDESGKHAAREELPVWLL